MAVTAANITSISSDTGTAGDYITNDQNLTINGTLSANNGVDTLRVFYVVGGVGTFLGTYQTPTNTTGTLIPWTLNVSGVTIPAGTYTLEVYAGTSTTYPGATGRLDSQALTIDTSAPTFGAITVAGDDHITTTGEEGTLHVTGSVTGANGQTVTVKLLADDGVTVLHTGTGTIGVGGAYDVTFSGFSFVAGNYKVQVSATDVAGNAGTSTIETFDSSVCFLAGTMIRTPDGETAIEKLAIGDLIVTADGSAKPVKFIGRQTVSMIFADNLKTQPILIKAGALGENVPARDLYTSPGHSMLIDGVLAISGALVNGRSIVRWQDVPTSFTYYHVELDGHEIVFAEGAATETYCDNVPREVFDNGRRVQGAVSERQADQAARPADREVAAPAAGRHQASPRRARGRDRRAGRSRSPEFGNRKSEVGKGRPAGLPFFCMWVVGAPGCPALVGCNRRKPYCTTAAAVAETRCNTRETRYCTLRHSRHRTKKGGKRSPDRLPPPHSQARRLGLPLTDLVCLTHPALRP